MHLWNEYYFLLHFSRNAEFVMTSTDPALCTNAPTTGFMGELTDNRTRCLWVKRR